MSARVGIIGAGPGGLASAMLLASSGCEVTVFESRDHVGGRTGRITADGFTFDIGPTFFLYPRVLEEIFAATGHRLRDRIDLRRVDPYYHLVFEQGGELKATHDLAGMQRMMAQLSPADAANLPRFLEDNRGKFEAFRPILESPFNSALDLLRPSLLKAAFKVRPHASVHGDLCRFFSDPRIQLAFGFQSKYLGMSPFQCPSLFTILSFLEYEYGVWHPIGGCNAVMQAMARICRDLGVDVRLADPVRALDFEGRRVSALRTTSGTHTFDAVVINADFAHTMRRLVPDALRRRWNDRRIHRAQFSCSTFMLYLGIEGSYPDLEHHTIWLAKDYECNIREIAENTLSANPSFYIQNAVRTDPTLAPPGHSTLYCLFPVSHQCDRIDWTREAPRMRELAFRQMARLGLGDLPKRIRFEKIITPADWQGEFHLHRGATFNLAHSLGQILHRRPHNRYEDLDNVYLVGGGTHPGSGLPVIFESARISSRLLLEDRRIPVHWPGQTGRTAKYAGRADPAPAVAPTTEQEKGDGRDMGTILTV